MFLLESKTSLRFERETKYQKLLVALQSLSGEHPLLRNISFLRPYKKVMDIKNDKPALILSTICVALNLHKNSPCQDHRSGLLLGVNSWAIHLSSETVELRELECEQSLISHHHTFETSVTDPL